MGKIIRIVLVLAVVVAAVGFGVVRFRAAKATAATKDKFGRTVTAKSGDIAITVSETGTLEPVTQVEVKSKVAGRLQHIFVKEGDRVKAGDPIAIIDPQEVRRDVDRIKAQLAASIAGLRQTEENFAITQRQNRDAVLRTETSLTEAKARLAQTAAPTRSQDIGQAQSAIRRAEAQVADARRSLERQQNLVDKGFVAQSQADSAKTALALAEADLASAKERVGLLQEGPRQEDVATAKAAVESARVALATERRNADQSRLRQRDIERARAEVKQIENQLAQQSVQLTETRIVAPLSGEITGKFLNEGELVASATAGFAQGAALVRIADLTHMQVRVNVNEVDVAKVRYGQPVEIRVDSVPGKKFAGKVAAIAPSSLGERQASSSGSSSSTSSQSVVRFEVKIAVDTPDPRLRPGMSAAIDILLDQRKNVVLLPTEALRPGDQVAVITGVGEKRAKAEHTVTVGLRNDAQAEITSGLKAGDVVEVPKVDAKDRRKINFDGPN